MGSVKTNALRILEQRNIGYEMIQYENRDGKMDGQAVAEKIGQDHQIVFKTLVTTSGNNTIYVFVIPVDSELDLKKAAKVSGEKKIEMLVMKDLQKFTGYIRGGCSPVGMKKQYRTYINDSAGNHEKIIVSAGKIGVQMKLKVEDLLETVNGHLADVIKR